VRAFAAIAAAVLSVACARASQVRPVEVAPAPAPAVAACDQCSADTMAPEVTQAIERRIAELATIGVTCAAYGEVLERSFRDRRISIRPYMWRMGARLVSGEASPDGEMWLAREIDPLNVGVRTIDDVMWTMEHEAAHVAFKLSSGDASNEERVNAVVRECSAATGGDRVRGNGRSPHGW
jgi:hypothetical protein